MYGVMSAEDAGSCVCKTCHGRTDGFPPQLLILSGRWGGRTAGPPAPASAVASSSSWTPRGGSADSAASAAHQGMLPGEPLWSGDASGGGHSGWAPYWGGRFELLQQVRLVSGS